MPDAGGDFVSARLRGRPATIRHAERPGAGATIGRSRSDADAPGRGDTVGHTNGPASAAAPAGALTLMVLIVVFGAEVGWLIVEPPAS